LDRYQRLLRSKLAKSFLIARFIQHKSRQVRK